MSTIATKPQKTKFKTDSKLTPTTPKLEKLIQKEQQLKALIEKEKARLTKDGRKQRNAKLIAWGIAIEKLFESSHESLTPELWATLCKQTLSGRQLENAFSDELKDLK